MSQKISGRMGYAGVSRNGKIYLPEEIAKGDQVTIPILLNHGDLIGAEDIPYSLLPKSYRERLLRGEEIILGNVKLSFDYDSAELFYKGIVTDPFYSQKHILKQMHVSQGVVYNSNASQKVCGKVQCFEIISGAIYQEMSLVFKPGLPLVSEIATENLQNTSHNYSITTKVQMDPTNPKEKQKSHEGADPPSAEPTQSQEQCPEGMAYNKETEQCEKIDTSQNSNPTTNEPPVQVAQASEADNGDDPDKDCKDCPDKDKDAKKKTVKGSPNADIASEKAYLESRLKAIEKSEGSEDELKALEHSLKKLNLQEQIRVAEEKVSGKAITSTKKSIATESIKNPAGSSDVIADEASPDMISWIKRVIAKENVMPSFVQKISKEAMLQKYLYANVTDYTGRVVAREKVYPDGTQKATEGVNPAADLGRMVSNQVFVLPNGKIVTPARQFCEMALLNQGETEGFFYDIGDVNFAGYTDGVDLAEQTIDVRSIGGEPEGRGKLVTVGYRQLHRSPFDVMSALQRAFAFESINDESVELFNRTYNDDTGTVTSSKKPTNGGAKSNWVNGNDGTPITGDSTMTNADKLSFAGILAGKKLIEDTGVDVSDLVLYTSTKGVQDLIQDPGIDSYIQFSKPEIITEANVARIAGINIVKSSAIADGTGSGSNAAKRSVLFKPFVSFGLVAERDLTMEAQRRNEKQSILLTGTQIIKGVVKQEETTCRFSHTNVA